MADLVLGVDLGATNIKTGLVTEDGEVVQHHRAETLADRGPAAVAQTICRSARECLDLAGLDVSSVPGLGVGSPGNIDLEAGVILFSPNLPTWRDVPLRRMIEEDLGLRCVLHNDANVAALAEQWVGAGRGTRALVLLTLGTGIGGGIVLDGRIWHGYRGVAGEIGHMGINADGPRCGCGSTGCLEAYAGATAMVRRMRESIAAGAESCLAERPEGITARAIHEAALAGDAAARQNIEQTGRYLGVGVSSIMHMLNPQVVAFSGGVTAAGEMLMAPLLSEVERRTMEAHRHGVKICFAELPEDAGVIGAARSFMIA